MGGQRLKGRAAGGIHPHVVSWQWLARRRPVVVLSGVLDDELRGRMFNLVVDEHFTKPVNVGDLYEVVPFQP